MMEDISGWQVRLDPGITARRRAAGAWRGRTVADDLRAWAERDPNRVCVRSADAVLRFGQALEGAERLAAGLWQLGLRPGDVVSFQLPNWLEAVTVNLACALLGIVVNPIVPIYRHAEVAQILLDCRAKAIFVPEVFRGFDHAAMLRTIAPDLPDLLHRIVLRGGQAGPGEIAFGDLLRGSGGAVPWPVQRPDSVKMVLYTSGTTGRAKGVLHTHETMPRSLDACMAHWGLTGEDVCLMPSPVTHVTGFSWALEMPFYHGIMAVVMERWQADEAVALIDRFGAAVTVGATPFLAELVDAAERANSRLPSLKVFACGGAAVPPGLIRRANALFANGRACRVYGSTEAPMVTLGWVGEGTAELAAATDGEIVDYEAAPAEEDGASLPPGTEGEMLVDGPALFVGYADPAETRAAFTPDGRFRMGDIGFVTAEGAVVITGRKKDLIIRGGENISAKEIEDALHSHPAIREAVAVAMPHPRLVETVCVFAIPRDGAAPTLADLSAHLGALGLAKQKLPEQLEIVDDLPRTASGKVKKDVLRQRAAGLVQARTEASLHGTWRLRSVSSWVGGEQVDPAAYGPNPTGFLHYLSGNRMAVTIAYDGRQAMQGDRLQATDAAKAEAYASFIAYAGTYRVEGDTVIHAVEMSAYQNDVGTSQIRFFRLDGDTLFLESVPLQRGGKPQNYKLVWERLRAEHD